MPQPPRCSQAWSRNRTIRPLITLAITINPPITSAASGQVTRGQMFVYEIEAPHTPNAFTAGPLPAGLSLSNSGVISGKPEVSGSFSFPLSASNGTLTASGFLTVHISPIAQTPLTAEGVAGRTFTYQITPSDPVTGYDAANLPAGLTIDRNSGVISGTPTTTGVFRPTISFTNAGGTGSAELVVTIRPLLTVAIEGPGSVTSGFAGETTRAPGESVTIKATAAAGAYFNGWTGGITSDSPTLPFTMSGNLALRAKFVPFSGSTGSYFGLVTSSSPAASGFTSVTLNANGSFSSAIAFGTARYGLRGTFDAAGRYTGQIVRRGALPLLVSLQLDSVTGGILGTFSVNGAVVSNLTMPRTRLGSGSPSHEGRYTLLLPSPGTAGVPGGTGYGSVTVDALGAVRFVGVMGDGTPVSQGSGVNAAGEWPLYAAAYTRTGIQTALITGPLFFRSTGAADLDGTLTWKRHAARRVTAFTASVAAIGSRYTFLPGERVLSFAEGYVTFLNGGLVPPTPARRIALTTANGVQLLEGERFTMRIDTATGLFSGTFHHLRVRIPKRFSGALFQKQDRGAGLFIGTGQVGAVEFDATE